MLYHYCCHPKTFLLCALCCLVIISFSFFLFPLLHLLYPSKYDICHVLQKLGHINPKGFSPHCGTVASFFFNPSMVYQKMSHDGNNIIIFMFHCFAIELCYVYACIAFVKLLILYCNKVFEISLILSHIYFTSVLVLQTTCSSWYLKHLSTSCFNRLMQSVSWN